MVLLAGRSFWEVSSGFQWLTVLVSTVKFVALNLKEVNNYGEFFNIQQQVSKVPLKQMTKFLRNSAYKISLKKTLGGWEKFRLLKIDIYSFMHIYPVWTPFLPILGQVFKGFYQGFGLLLVDKSVF